MKPTIFIISALLTILISCGTTTPDLYDQPTLDRVVVIRVEYRYTRSLEMTIWQIMKLARVSDWDSTTDNTGLAKLEARYAEITPAKALEIQERLNELGGVLFVELIKDHRPLKNIF